MKFDDLIQAVQKNHDEFGTSSGALEYAKVMKPNYIPLPTLIGLAIYGTVFLVIKNFNICCGIGGATIALVLGISQQWLLLGYAVAVFLFIPIKLFIDSPRRKVIGEEKYIDLK